jgi:hypothetical protein
MDSSFETIEKGQPLEDLFQNGLGENVHPLNAIFPIFEVKNGNLWVSSGTGFFVLHNNPYFATAKHNLTDNEGVVLPHLAAIQCVRNGSKFEYFPRRIRDIKPHPNADIAIGLLGESLIDRKPAPDTNEAFLITGRHPTKEERIATFAIPKPIVNCKSSEVIDIEFAPRLMYGNIQAYLPTGRPSLGGECYQTSMGFEGGASGGPVFGTDERVFGINSRAFELNSDHDGLPAISWVSSVRAIADLLE